MGGKSSWQTVGYKYFLGMHLALCHGPIDFVSRVRVDKRTVFEGVRAGGQVSFDAPNLFGGEDREGGVAGTIDIELGGPTQEPNDYLALAISGSRFVKKDGVGLNWLVPGESILLPAFRGVTAAVFRHVWIGNTPYVKPWSFRAQRIHVRQDGLPQWYPERAEIVPSSAIFEQAYTDFTTGFETNAPPRFQIIDGMICNTLENAQNSDYWRATLPSMRVVGLRCEFTLIDRDQGDPIGIALETETGTRLIGFNMQTEHDVDSLGRPAVHYWDGPVPTPIYDKELSEGVFYRFEADLMPHRGVFAYRLYEGSVLLSSGEATLPAGTPVYLTFGRTSNVLPGATGIGGFSSAIVLGYIEADMNPAHIIRECLTDPDWGMGYHEEDVDDDEAFRKAADTLHDERMGISIMWQRESPIEDFINEIIRHIDAALYLDRTTGKFVLKLIRDDYDVADLITLGESDIERVEDHPQPAPGELVNSVIVRYWDRVKGEPASVGAQDIAMVAQQGVVISESVDYMGFTSGVIASRVARRDLLALSTALVSCTIYAHRKAAQLRIGDPFTFDWPRYQSKPLVMRVTDLALGDGRSNVVRVKAVQDVFSLPATGFATAPIQEWREPPTESIPSDNRAVIEAPYYALVLEDGQLAVDTSLEDNPFAGFLLATAARADTFSKHLEIWVDPDGSGFAESGRTEFCPVAAVAEEIDPDRETIPIALAYDIAEVRLGSIAVIGGVEIVRVDEISPIETGPIDITVGRGALDTVPVKHALGTPIHFFGDFAGGDGIEYADGEVISVKLRPVGDVSPPALDDVPPDEVEMNQRAFRPYPPGRFLLDALKYPAVIAGDNPALTVGWAHRDRLQQTSGEVVDSSDGDIGPEPGTTYNLRIYAEDGTTLLREELALMGTEFIYGTAAEVSDAGGEFETFYDDMVLALSPTHYWRMNEAEPAAALVDLIAGYSASLSGTYMLGQPGLLAGDADTAVQWDGSSSHARAAADADHLLGIGDFGVSTLLEFSHDSHSSALAVRAGATILCIVSTGRISLGDISAETWAWSDVAKRVRSSAMNDGQPHPVFVRYTHASTQLDLFIDGELVDSRAQGSGRPVSGELSIWLGNNEAVDQGFSGTQDEVALFNYGPTDGEIAKLASIALNGPDAEGARKQGKLRVALESERDGITSWQRHNWTITRAGYGFNYGLLYGGQ